jgi:uncharacterized protein (TIGR02646 family)
MKYIIKGNPPASLQRWFTRQHGINCSFEDMPTAIKAEVKTRLLEEQGYLCCYTGKRIDMQSSHIEHLKPQALSRRDGDHEDVEYNNMLAAFPKEDNPPCPYGAKKRGDWYSPEFVHPLRRDCEQRFKFNLKGEISPRENNDLDAAETIKRLGLDDKYLDDDREEAIDELLFREKISEAQAKRLREQIMQRDSRGRFRAFCFVLEQACAEYIRRLEKRHARRLAIQRRRG